jgi:hypothetical protein
LGLTEEVVEDAPAMFRRTMRRVWTLVAERSDDESIILVISEGLVIAAVTEDAVLMKVVMVVGRW